MGTVIAIIRKDTIVAKAALNKTFSIRPSPDENLSIPSFTKTKHPMMRLGPAYKMIRFLIFLTNTNRIKQIYTINATINDNKKRKNPARVSIQ
jgi:hypothetical protein